MLLLCRCCCSLRCAAFTHLNFLPAALEDARDCVRHCPRWEKGWARLGSVQFRIKCLSESLLSYEKGEVHTYMPSTCLNIR